MISNVTYQIYWYFLWLELLQIKFTDTFSFHGWKQYYFVVKSMVDRIALPLDSLLESNVSARPCFCLRAQHRKKARRRARPRDGLKAGLAPRLPNIPLFYIISTMVDWMDNFLLENF